MQLSKEKKYWLLIGKTWFGMGQSWYRERRLRTWEPLRLTAARLNMKFCFAADDSVLAPQNFMYHYDFKRIRASAAFLCASDATLNRIAIQHEIFLCRHGRQSCCTRPQKCTRAWGYRPTQILLVFDLSKIKLIMHTEKSHVYASPVQGEVLSAAKRRGCWELRNS